MLGRREPKLISVFVLTPIEKYGQVREIFVEEWEKDEERKMAILKGKYIKGGSMEVPLSDILGVRTDQTINR